tara:strand:- start:1669 stop:2607 length:939 start_codon:yes stop_codon:yes gene_type:complete
MTTKTKSFPKKGKIVEVEENINIPPYEERNATEPVVEETPKPIKKVVNPFVSNNASRTRPSMYKLTRNKKDRKTGKVMYPVIYMIKAEDIIFDPIKGINRKIRYIPGEASIYEDEQKKDAKVKAPVIFNDGFLAVPPQNPTLKKFLDHCNQNGDNPNRIKTTKPAFVMVNKKKDAKKLIQKESQELDAMQLALKMPIEKLVGYAKVLGINVDKSTEEIRYDMKIAAKRNPSSFISGMDDPKTAIKETIINAKEYGIISIEKNKISWIRGGARTLITHTPIGKDSTDHFVDYCMDGDGELVLDEIKRQIKNFN